jgi:hypothetical protein
VHASGLITRTRHSVASNQERKSIAASLPPPQLGTYCFVELLRMRVWRDECKGCGKKSERIRQSEITCLIMETLIALVHGEIVGRNGGKIGRVC